MTRQLEATKSHLFDGILLQHFVIYYFLNKLLNLILCKLICVVVLIKYHFKLVTHFMNKYTFRYYIFFLSRLFAIVYLKILIINNHYFIVHESIPNRYDVKNLEPK